MQGIIIIIIIIIVVVVLIIEKSGYGYIKKSNEFSLQLYC